MSESVMPLPVFAAPRIWWPSLVAASTSVCTGTESPATEASWG